MVIILLTVLSLSVIYLLRLFSRKKMKVASLATAVLYVYCVGYIYTMFIFDFFNLGFDGTETVLSLIHGSDTYHSFVKIAEKMAVMPLPFLKATVYLSVFILLCAITVCFHGFFEISLEVIRFVKRATCSRSNFKKQKIISEVIVPVKRPLIRLYCRANC